MKIHGKKVQSSYEEVVVIPRNDENLVFKARAISDYSPFEKMCPEPQGVIKMLPGGRQIQDIASPEYLKKQREWAEHRTHWMILESLKATPGLEWETVKPSDPTTWKNYGDEMTSAGLSPAEQGRIVHCVSIANGLDQSKIDEATESFLASQAAATLTKSSQDSELLATPSGEPVSVSA
jgi:hypothetical protein